MGFIPQINMMRSRNSSTSNLSSTRLAKIQQKIKKIQVAFDVSLSKIAKELTQKTKENYIGFMYRNDVFDNNYAKIEGSIEKKRFIWNKTIVKIEIHLFETTFGKVSKIKCLVTEQSTIDLLKPLFKQKYTEWEAILKNEDFNEHFELKWEFE